MHDRKLEEHEEEKFDLAKYDYQKLIDKWQPIFDEKTFNHYKRKTTAILL